MTEEQVMNKDLATLIKMSKALSGDLRSEEHVKRLELINSLISERTRGDTPVVRRRVGPRVTEDTSEELQRKLDSDELVARRYIATKEGAKRRGIQFTLTLADMRRLMCRKRCAYTGLPFVREGGHRQRPSLERLDSDKGYTKENTVLVCMFANELKNLLSEDMSSQYYMEPKVLRNFIRSAL